MTIALTALATLIVTILAGLLLDYLRKARARIHYAIKDAVPINLEGKVIGAYLVAFANVSKQTINDVTCVVNASPAVLRNGGISAAHGMKYQASEEQGGVQVAVPYLSPGDELQMTLIAESDTDVPVSPDVAIRTPQQVAVVNIDAALGRPLSRTSLLLPAAVAAIVTALGGLTMSGISLFTTQADVLTFAAATAALPHLAQTYATGGHVMYAHQGDLALAYAQSETAVSERERYRTFLRLTLEVAPHMATRSRALLTYALGRIDLAMGDSGQAEDHIRQALSMSRDAVGLRTSHDDQVQRFMVERHLN